MTDSGSLAGTPGLPQGPRFRRSGRGRDLRFHRAPGDAEAQVQGPHLGNLSSTARHEQTVAEVREWFCPLKHENCPAGLQRLRTPTVPGMLAAETVYVISPRAHTHLGKRYPLN